ncbi:MAG TPA: hypothetical protein PKC18_01905 [Lacipirellulaceae bacterium]|nr:hypothetical protein [Lacipirellulaceae bacterium]
MSEYTLSAYRLKVRVGESEFEAEGPEETVKSQFEMFLTAVSAGKNGKSSASPRTGEGSDDLMSDGTWGRFYKLEGEFDVSLKVLPSTDNSNADALVLLLYGYLMLRKVDTVGSTDLLAMAKKSGLRIDRIDRNIPVAFGRYLNRGGTRKGCRYSLNNQGQMYAQNLLETLADL